MIRNLALLSAMSVLPIAVLASAGAAPNAITGASGTVWAVERHDGGPNTLAAFDAGTGTVLGVVTLGTRPIGVSAPRGTGKVYTADERSNQLSVISKDDLSTVQKTIAMGAFPHHMMASPNGRFIYVAQYDTNTIGVVDTTLDVRVHDWEASGDLTANTHAVWITNDGKDLYATNEGPVQTGPGTLSKLDALTGFRAWEIPIGNRPSEVLVTPDRKTAYVTLRQDNAVKVLDVSGGLPVELATIFIGIQPDTMQLTNDAKTLVVGLRSIPQMALMDTRTSTVRFVTFPGYGISGHQWLSAQGTFTFIALENADLTQPGAIGVVDNASGAIVATWPYPFPGGSQPHGVFYEPEVLG
jgi:DNA-binding beta-propeller fold protein YncE